MGILSWMIAGGVAGWLSGVMMQDRVYDLFTTVLIGIFGALVGGFLAGIWFGMYDPISNFNLSTLAVSIVGAVLAVAVFRAFPGRTPV